MTDHGWCKCGDHRLDQGRPLCPVCEDRAAKEAEAKIALMWGHIQGGGFAVSGTNHTNGITGVPTQPQHPAESNLVRPSTITATEDTAR